MTGKDIYSETDELICVDKLVIKLDKQKAIIDELAAALKDTCSTILDKDACSKICEECHVYIALQKV